MKKSLIISIGVALALIVGGLFYSMGVPKDISAALYAGNRTGNTCKITVGDDTWEKPCATLWSSGSDIGGTLGAGSVSCNVDGSCSYETSGGSYAGTSLTYFTEAQASAFMQGGGTDTQVSAINGIYAACQALIASKPVVEDGAPDPRSVSCGNVKWACRPDGTIGCKRIDTDAWIGNPYHPETTACNNSNGYGGVCGGSTDGLGCSLSGSSFGGGTNALPVITTLRVGSEGVAVAEVQSLLAGIGYYSGTIDGSYGKGTATAVAAWQTANGMKGDGVWQYDTRDIVQKPSGKYYCSMPTGHDVICIQPGQPTGANCGTLPPEQGQACSYAGMTGNVTQAMQTEGQSNTPSL